MGAVSTWHPLTAASWMARGGLAAVVLLVPLSSPPLPPVAVAALHAQSPYEAQLEIRPSRIPHAGNGVFTKAAIPNGAYLGAYTGEFITEEEYRQRANTGGWTYMMGLLDCARPHTGDLVTIDGVRGNVFTRMNYAPPEFQNVKFVKVCEAPFVRVVALRDIAAGEELWVDYGPNYRYDFMKDPAVIKFFDDLRASARRRRP